MSNKSIFSTFARTLPPSGKVSKSIAALLVHYGWKKVRKRDIGTAAEAAFEVVIVSR